MRILGLQAFLPIFSVVQMLPYNKEDF